MKSAKLGQHFLKNDETLRRLVEQVRLPPKRIIEIGAGDGRLTRLLLEAGHLVTSYELDSGLYDITKRRLGDAENLRLMMGDGFEDEETYDALVSSLPYYASRRFVEWFSSSSTPLGIVVLQKDFADKLVSDVGSRKYGAYSVLASCCFAMEELFIIPPHDFEPRPRVFSSALRMERLRSVPEARLTAVKLKALFSYRGRLAASFVRDMKKRGLWGDCGQAEGSLLRKRVEELAPAEAMSVIQRMKQC